MMVILVAVNAYFAIEIVTTLFLNLYAEFVDGIVFDTL